MKNPEDAIEQVLTALRDVETPQGMERRIFEAAQARTLERKGPTVAALLGARPWAVAVAGVVLLSLAASIALHRKNPGLRESAGVIPQPALGAPGRASEALVTSSEGLRPRDGIPVVHPQSHTRGAAPKPLSDEDALALSEMLAPSKPAPPLPLTHQERLLAEAVSRGGPEELSSLRPDVRDREMELSRAEFHDFFEPAPAKGNE
jgi:hypothetical protein